MLNVWYSVYSIHHSYYYITSTNVKKEMGKGREEGSELTLNFYYMPGGSTIIHLFLWSRFYSQFFPCSSTFVPFHRGHKWTWQMPCQRRSLNAMGTQRKDNRLSRIIKEGNTEDATFELGLKGWVGVWEAKTSNHFIIHNIWGLDC